MLVHVLIALVCIAYITYYTNYYPGVKYDFSTIPAANLDALRLNIEAIRTPLPMRYYPDSFEIYPLVDNPNVSCELPDFTHDEIMAIALDDAGVATRDQTLLQLNQAAKANITPQ